MRRNSLVAMWLISNLFWITSCVKYAAQHLHAASLKVDNQHVAEIPDLRKRRSSLWLSGKKTVQNHRGSQERHWNERSVLHQLWRILTKAARPPSGVAPSADRPGRKPSVLIPGWKTRALLLPVSSCTRMAPFSAAGPSFICLPRNSRRSGCCWTRPARSSLPAN